MSENKDTTAITITNNYPDNKYNLLIPIKTMQEISPLHKVVINEVQVNPNPVGKDVYKEKNGEMSLTKIGLAKLMTAANIQILESKPVTPQKCNRCTEMAARTKMAPKCYECPYIEDVAYQVSLAVPEPSGTWRKVVATKEIRMDDAKKTMTDKQYQAFFPFRTEQCESKALNRALREALMIKSTYKAEELQKSFVVAYVVPNMADEDLKKVMINKYAESSAMLFGGNNGVQAIEEPKEIIFNNETIVAAEDEEISPDNSEIVDAEIIRDDEHFIGCEKCGIEIEAINEQWTIEAIVSYSKEKFKGKVYCPDCQREILAAFRKAKEAKEASK